MVSDSSDQNHNSKDDELRFGMLGEDHSTSREKLEKYTGVVDWPYLKPHYENDALVFVDPSLSLTEVGEAFANDESGKVQAWRKSGDLLTPSEPHAEFWEKSQTHFRALVVSPFVLIQPSEESSVADKSES